MKFGHKVKNLLIFPFDIVDSDPKVNLTTKLGQISMKTPNDNSLNAFILGLVKSSSVRFASLFGVFPRHHIPGIFLGIGMSYDLEAD